MSEVSKVHTGPSIQNNVTHVKGVKSAYRVPQCRAMSLMLEVLKVHRGPSVQSNVTHVKGVKSSSICTIWAVILCMSKVSNVAQYTL